MMRVTRDTFSRRFRRLAGRLSAGDVDALIERLQQLDLAPGEVVIAEAAPFDALVLVWEGELNVTIETTKGVLEAGRVGPGSFLGEASLLDPGPASATVVADQGCVVLRLDRAAFDAMRTETPALAAGLLEELAHVLASRVRAAGERLDDLVADGVTGLELLSVQRRLHQDDAA